MNQKIFPKFKRPVLDYMASQPEQTFHASTKLPGTASNRRVATWPIAESSWWSVWWWPRPFWTGSVFWCCRAHGNSISSVLRTFRTLTMECLTKYHDNTESLHNSDSKVDCTTEVALTGQIEQFHINEIILGDRKKISRIFVFFWKKIGGRGMFAALVFSRGNETALSWSSLYRRGSLVPPPCSGYSGDLARWAEGGAYLEARGVALSNPLARSAVSKLTSIFSPLSIG